MMFDVDESHPDYKTGNYLAGPNQWPDEMPSLKNTMSLYRDAMIKLSSKLVEAFSIAFGLEQTTLNRFFINPTFFLRLHRYPPQLPSAHKEQFGVAPHTDISFMTFIAQDNIGGLMSFMLQYLIVLLIVLIMIAIQFPFSLILICMQ
ncbi:MAG: hypothetical protein AAGB12_15350 [Pseudomonadota bacterium]